jgi:muramoyltetrapeptide carboxypeptidase
VAALSGPVDPARLERGLAALCALGFEPVPARNLAAVSAAGNGLFAGDDRERLDAFHELAADPGLPAIFFARGGHGLLRLLPRLDWDLLARAPRAYVGYSDLTPFLLEVVRRLGLVAFHGPLVAADLARGLAPEEEESLLGALAGRYPAAHPLEAALRPGSGEGPLLGGCLSLLVATLGTPFAPDLAGSVLFVEDINEPVYKLDRMLTHLRLSGSLDAIRAMVIGHFDSGGPGAPGGEREALAALVTECLAGFDWPLAWGGRSGHRAPNLTLPLGLPARLEDGPRLVLGARPAHRGTDSAPSDSSATARRLSRLGGAG